jgi:hypothetical protein
MSCLQHHLDLLTRAVSSVCLGVSGHPYEHSRRQVYVWQHLTSGAMCMVQVAVDAASELVRAGTSDPTTRIAPVNVAALKGDVRALSLLIHAGAPVNKSDARGLTPLTVSPPGPSTTHP